jgi:hypothetical protein
MKEMKRILAIVLKVFMMVTVMAACGTTTQTSGGTNPTAALAVTTAAPAGPLIQISAIYLAIGMSPVSNPAHFFCIQGMTFLK